MEVLIVEDDSSSRFLLKTILTHRLKCDVVEARDGLEGLLAIDKHVPDLILLDTNMPVLDGVAMLEAVRASPVHAHIPVVSISSVTDRNTILKLISLGIEDYVFKPFDPGDVRQRIGTVLWSIEQRKTKPEEVQLGEKKTLLLIDTDATFRTLAAEVLSQHFNVMVASSGSEGVALLLEHHPHLVCVGAGMTLINDRVIARTVQSMSGQRPAVYLMSDRTELSDEHEGFDGVVAKTFVPGLLLKEVQRTIGADSWRSTLLPVLEKELVSELVTSIRQTVGVMMMQGVRTIGDGVLIDIPRQVEGAVKMCDVKDGVDVSIHLYGAQDEIVELGTLAVGKDLDFENGVSQVFGEFLETIGGRMRSTLGHKGLLFEQSEPEVRLQASTEETSGPRGFAVPFQCQDGQRFVVVVEVGNKAADGADAEAPPELEQAAKTA